MAGFSIVIDDAQVNALLEGMSGFELLELAEIGGTELEKLSKQAFETKQDPVTGKTWPKSGSTGKGRDESGRFIKGTGKQDTLYDTGRLMRSVWWDASGRGELLRVGSNMEYARIHQEGGRAGRGRKVEIPQRRYLGAPDGWVPELLGMPQVKKLLGMEPKV